MKELSLKDIKIDTSSYVDPNGFLFHYNNEIYRAIGSESEFFYKDLFKKGIIEKLCKQFHLVSSEITDYSIPEINCNLVLKHRKIEPATYCIEWCPSMLKRAALATIELSITLADYNCMLQDAYPWNIMFESTNPVFVDLTSIIPIKSRIIWPAYQQFINFFLNPLKLASMGKGKIARLLLHDYINGVTLSDLHAHYGLLYSTRHPVEVIFSSLHAKIVDKIQNNQALKAKVQDFFKSRILNQHNDRLRKKFFKMLLKKVNRIRIREEKTTWKNYYKNIEKHCNIQKKDKTIESLLSELQPKSVLDIGCNIGRYSIVASKKGAKVISIDSSEYCIEQLFKRCCEDKHNLIPIIGDILCPNPSFGFLSRQFLSLVQRVKSEVVLCLSLMHHLHINGRQSFDRIALMLDELSFKAVIFEYVDLTDNNIHLLDHGRRIDYSINTVSESLSKYFKLSIFDSDRDTRKIILCKK
jgi:2-polyprenyl-3-methyl-5-hydroxy-6-metoxy-1,4-benzoquinol methylase